MDRFGGEALRAVRRLSVEERCKLRALRTVCDLRETELQALRAMFTVYASGGSCVRRVRAAFDVLDMPAERAQRTGLYAVVVVAEDIGRARESGKDEGQSCRGTPVLGVRRSRSQRTAVSETRTTLGGTWVYG